MIANFLHDVLDRAWLRNSRAKTFQLLCEAGEAGDLAGLAGGGGEGEQESHQEGKGPGHYFLP